MFHPGHVPPSAPIQSTRDHEPVWKATVRDLPVAILATGIGYGIGRTIADAMADHMQINGVRPGWLRHMPLITSGVGTLTTIAQKQVARKLHQRRMEELDRQERAGERK